MSGKTLKFDNIEVDQKEFHASKQAIDLNLVDIKKIVISYKFKHSNNGFKCFVGYKDDKVAMSFMIEDDRVLVKYNEIWSKI